MPTEVIGALLDSALTHALLALFLCAGAAVLAGVQLRRLGIDSVPLPGIPAWRWSAAGAMLTFWLSAATVTPLLAGSAPLSTALLTTLSRLGAGTCCMWLAAWLGRVRILAAEDLDRPARQAATLVQWRLLAAGGVMAALALTGGSGLILVLVIVGAIGVLLFTRSGLSDSLAGALMDLGAGVALRGRLKAGDTVELDGRSRVLPASAGLLRTPYRDHDAAPGVNRESARNTDLLRVLDNAAPPPRGRDRHAQRAVPHHVKVAPTKQHG